MNNFFLFIGSEFTSSVGNGVYRVALNWALVTRYDSARVLALVQFLSLLFGAVVQWRSGNLIDRYHGKRVLVTIDFVLGLVAAGLSWLALNRPDEYPPLLSLFFIMTLGAIGAAVEPAFFSMMTTVRQRPANTTANSWMLGSYAVSGILGPVFGGILIQASGVWMGFAVDALSFFIGAALMTRVAVDVGSERHEKNLYTGQNPWLWTWRAVVVRRIFTFEAFANLAVATFMIGLPLIVSHIPNAGALGLGFFYGSFYLGVFTATVIVPRWAQKIPQAAVAYSSPFAIVLGMFLALYGHHVGLAVTGVFLTGFGLPWIDVLTRGAVLESVPQHLLGRITAVGSVVSTVSKLIALAMIAAWGALDPIWVMLASAWLAFSAYLLTTSRTSHGSVSF
ncbi:permease [Sulfobacillus acidophilus TPY]|uniref:Major facilitator superfamily MFS_1 n=1 Tax=Sulfobacillus acidophilus (strain ATCC 700253 / DSM 10332 / NAL) TaxID=679936 RepID=G8TS84_SULAD|nr:permease [Sulfobacillus acidophilus TPY]AEW05496.1 major facilitator superfamily MFS_1 [Sulfobacillus acidophilus DSM 10332]